MLSSTQHSPEKRRPSRTALYRAKAFKEKEEEKHLNEVSLSTNPEYFELTKIKKNGDLLL
jgi:hypothetical protein